MQEREQVKDKNHSIYFRWTWIQSLKQGSSDKVLRGNVQSLVGRHVWGCTESDTTDIT